MYKKNDVKIVKYLQWNHLPASWGWTAFLRAHQNLSTTYLHSAESLFKMHDTEKLYFCDHRCKILYDSICKQGEFISVYSWIWNPDVQFACAACSIQCLSCMHKIFSSSAIPYRLALEFDWQANGMKVTSFWEGGVDVDKFIKISYYLINILINGTLCNNLWIIIM